MGNLQRSGSHKKSEFGHRNPPSPHDCMSERSHDHFITDHPCSKFSYCLRVSGYNFYTPWHRNSSGSRGSRRPGPPLPLLKLVKKKDGRHATSFASHWAPLRQFSGSAYEKVHFWYGGTFLTISRSSLSFKAFGLRSLR